MDRSEPARPIRKKSLSELDLSTLTHFVLTARDRTDFHRGIRLFNQARFWEAHEAWEAVWLRHPEDGRFFIQGLIQLAAAYHQLRRRIYRGFLIHLGRAQERLVLFPDLFLGIDVADLRNEIRRVLPPGDSKEAEDGADYSRIVPPRIRVVDPPTPYLPPTFPRSE